MRSVSRWLSLLVASAALLAGAGCGGLEGDGVRSPADIDRDMRAYMDSQYEAELPPLPSDEEIELLALRNLHRSVAEDMTARAREALEPIGDIASIFLPDGPIDVFLGLLPAEKLGDLLRVGRDAIKARKKGRDIAHLAKHFDDLLDKDHRKLVRALTAMSELELRALKGLHKHTRSPAAVRAIAIAHARGHADPTWILGRLERKVVDGDFVRRFTFDGDFVAEFSTHSANPSWDTLRQIVEGSTVSAGLRASLAVKVKGLMGERAAASLLREPRMLKKYLGRGNAHVQTWRGVRYGKGGSIDVLLHATRNKEVLVAEVKTWSAEMWQQASKREGILDQLGRHDGGMDEILSGAGAENATVKGKILFVEDSGFRAGMDDKARMKFEKVVEDQGWTLETFPGDQVITFAELIDSLR